MSTAEIILEQLGGASRLGLFLGAKNFMSDNDGKTLIFRVGSGAKRRITVIKITLTPSDLYDVEFGKVYQAQYKQVAQEKGIFNDMLCKVIETHTGFFLSL